MIQEAEQHRLLAEQRSRFHTVTLQELERASLQSRVEEKFILPECELPVLLHGLEDNYNILQIDGKTSFEYYTRYFDTPGFRLYLDHHNGYANRLKVRYRLYKDTGDCFFELKYKRQETFTEKYRFPAEINDQLTAAEKHSIVYPRIAADELVHTLSNTFTRITLCSKDFSERLTIDSHISMTAGDETISLPGVIIAERKSAAGGARPVISMLKQYVAEWGFSKYTMGTALLYPHIKHNNFKPVLRNLARYAYQ